VRWLPRLIACLVVLGGLLLWEQTAHATILPACEAEPMLTPMPAAPEPTCSVVTTVDEDTGETSAAPICDPDGMSAVAPPRIYPVSDASIRDGTPLCDDWLEQAVQSGGEERSSDARGAWLDPYLAPEVQALRHTGGSLLNAPLPSSDGARPGHIRDVYHPPR
jgi:hypothetical protein